MDYAFQEWPKMLFRDDDYLIVEDADEESAAIVDGWRVSLDPLDHDGDGKPGGARRGRPPKV